MNTGYFDNLNDNFNEAVNILENNYSHQSLMELLKNGNIVQKQLSVLSIETIPSKEDADILISNLTNQDGKVREAVSCRIKEFMSDKNLSQYFRSINYYDIFLDAIIDINGNICRNIITAIDNLKEDKCFCNYFCTKLTILTNNLLDIIETFNFKEGKYKVNKEVFKLYWCLETIYHFYNKIEFSILKQILLRSSKIDEYTIREKVAKILTYDLKDKDIEELRKNLKKDKNYYVRRY